MANIKVKAQSREARFVDEGAEIAGIAHFAHGVLHADRDARMMRVQNQVLESTESSVALSRIGGLGGAAPMPGAIAAAPVGVNRTAPLSIGTACVLAGKARIPRMDGAVCA